MSAVYYIPTDEGELLVSTVADRSKARIVSQNGKVSLCVLDERWPFAYLQVYADATVDRDPELVVDVMMAVGVHERPISSSSRLCIRHAGERPPSARRAWRHRSGRGAGRVALPRRVRGVGRTARDDGLGLFEPQVCRS